jgi:hypothetical protein
MNKKKLLIVAGVALIVLLLAGRIRSGAHASHSLRLARWWPWLGRLRLGWRRPVEDVRHGG